MSDFTEDMLDQPSNVNSKDHGRRAAKGPGSTKDKGANFRDGGIAQPNVGGLKFQDRKAVNPATGEGGKFKDGPLGL